MSNPESTLPQVSALRILWRIARLRFWLMLRQRLGWSAMSMGAGGVILSLLFARASWINSLRIFWDFSLGLSFVIQSSLVVYLGSQLFNDERNRRTLHLLLASGVPRACWLLGNGLGLWLGLGVMNITWFVLTIGASYMEWGQAPLLIAAQAQWILAIEILVVTFAGMLLSLLVRPILAFIATASMFVFLHSTGSIARIFDDKESGKLIEATGLKTVLAAAKILPPLEWFDLRVFLGYQNSVGWQTLGALTLLGLLWSALLASLSVLRFDRMDL